MGKIADKYSEKVMSFMEQYFLRKLKMAKLAKLWRKIIQKACETTEGIDESYAKWFVSSGAVKRHYLMLINEKMLDNIYYSFIITVAVELCTFNMEKNFVISFATAILDNWFELNKVDCNELKKTLNLEELTDIVSNREKLYHEYFLLYKDVYSRDVIRVYYPRNGESWIDWDKNCSVDVNINLSKGTDFGFCKVGFSYSRIRQTDGEKFLKVAYINEDREIFRFEHEDLSGIDPNNIIWIM